MIGRNQCNGGLHSPSRFLTNEKMFIGWRGVEIRGLMMGIIGENKKTWANGGKWGLSDLKWGQFVAKFGDNSPLGLDP